MAYSYTIGKHVVEVYQKADKQQLLNSNAGHSSDPCAYLQRCLMKSTLFYTWGMRSTSCHWTNMGAHIPDLRRDKVFIMLAYNVYAKGKVHLKNTT